MTVTPAIPQADLASLAQKRAIAKTVSTALSTTRYWHYPPAGQSPETAETAETVILIHGYRGNHRGLEAIAGALKDFNVLIPDLPGFGESSPFGVEHSVETYAQWVEQFIAALALKKKPHLLGHSFGSIVTACHAASTPDIASLLLINPVSAPALKGPRQLLTRLTQLFYWTASTLPLTAGLALLKSRLIVRGMSVVMAKTKVRALRRWIHRQHDENFSSFAELRVATEGFKASISHNVSEYAGSIGVPTLMVIGHLDDITSVRQQRQAAKLFEAVTLRELPEVGHLSHYEAPQETANFVRDFLKTL